MEAKDKIIKIMRIIMPENNRAENYLNEFANVVKLIIEPNVPEALMFFSTKELLSV